MTPLPRRLAAHEAGWTRTADVVVVGSGIAGLSAALHARAAVAAVGGTVLLVTKALLDAGSTRWAQGGIAAALAPDDSPEDHLRDTLVAGVGLCDEAAVRVLVTEGPARVRELAALGAGFDLADEPSGAVPSTPGARAFALTREGGHLRDRVVHAGGDATGAEVERALIAAVRSAPGIEVVEHALVLDLLLGASGQAAGITLHVLGEGSRDGVGAVLARAVVLATGGMGQVFASTTNPAVSTGDGVALALRAGAEVADLEFVQFHPTALWLGAGAAAGQQPLVSEAMRGEGAVLVDASGRRVITVADHPLADLAPRDIVAKAMSRRMAALGVDHLYLDATGLGAATLLRRFPTITARCRLAGVDPVTEPIPVAPAAHYASGGVRTDLFGRTAVPGLYACGEVACTGVHGANRLASNSLLEGLVFAARIGADLAAGLPPRVEPVDVTGPAGLLAPESRPELAQAMTDGAGVLRSADSLAATAKALDALGEPRALHAIRERSALDALGEPGAPDALGGLSALDALGGRRAAGDADAAGATVLVPGQAPVIADPDAWEATDLHTVATALVAAARLREETRGSHWREDFPDAEPRWHGSLVTRMDPDGTLVTRFEARP